jgi:hypothetical protein
MKRNIKLCRIGIQWFEENIHRRIRWTLRSSMNKLKAES